MAQINPKFQLSNPKATVETSINLVFYYGGGKRLFYSTGKKVDPKQWDSEKERIKNTRGDLNTRNKNKGINKRIEDIIDKVDQIFDDYDRRRVIPTKGMIKAELDKSFKATDSTGPMNLIQFAQKVIDDSTDGARLTKKGKRIAEVTIKGYQTTLNHLEDFHKSKRFPMNFEDIDMTFYKTFVRYFNSEKKATNTIGKNIKNVKVFLKEAYKLGLSQNKIFENEDFRVIEEETDQIYLSMEELTKLYNHDFKADKRLERVRDLFVLGCFTGLRFGDMEGLSKDNIIERGTRIKLRMKKTGDLVVIPLHSMAKSILKKYKGSPPPIISNQKLNEYLKEMGGKAKINEQVSKTITRGGMRTDKIEYKYNLITVHTARRSFATNMYLADVPTLSIRMITGHRTEKSFLKYIRISAEENADLLMTHVFFMDDQHLKVAK